MKPSASGAGGGQIDSPTHGGVLLGALGEAAGLGDGLWATLAVVELALEACGCDAGCDAHAVTPPHPIAMRAINRNVLANFNVGVPLIPGRLGRL